MQNGVADSQIDLNSTQKSIYCLKLKLLKYSDEIYQCQGCLSDDWYVIIFICMINT